MIYKDNKYSALYIHIPFCLKKCPYCDFHSYQINKPSKWSNIQQYIDYLHDQIKKQPPYKLQTIFLGGGTPSLLSNKQIIQLFSRIYKHFKIAKNIEITIEINPETLLKNPSEKLGTYKEVGINRLSFGMQSFDDNILKRLGRIHNSTTNYKAYSHALSAGFNNINIDLIFAIPSQTLSSWENTLIKTIKLQPKHISIYNLTSKHGTLPVLQNQELDLKMYKSAIKILQKNNYQHYEISNFAKTGFQSQHNMTYWLNKPYLGLGDGASSSSLQNINDPAITVIMGLRLLKKGISYSRFRKQHNKDLLTLFDKKLQTLQEQSLLKKDKQKLLLTKKGLYIANQVFEEFLV